MKQLYKNIRITLDSIDIDSGSVVSKNAMDWCESKIFYSMHMHLHIPLTNECLPIMQ